MSDPLPRRITIPACGAVPGHDIRIRLLPFRWTGLSRALSHLAEVEEKVEQVHVEQANGDFFQLSETIRDYVALLGAVKVRGGPGRDHSPPHPGPSISRDAGFWLLRTCFLNA